ncbi:MAG: carboxymuconolactone decarboxylase family protein [Sphingobacterium sp.]|uniref:carboxymuconolactone decarboxylase family protein n=1 Tax=Sphingobacterium sp. JB170 TaxID=1434842 RepID=UPI00097F138A|nr:carboxymuconolactone decarboxylase family protein [Sphingobacterium sp. JB170]SJN47718.1 4-carboxymuconolactone decarboxylase domain/alkylhydroperoxidase AhpD family core domain protein [Sphingobacterium sp. JB170]
MAQRKFLQEIDPTAFEVMLGFEKYLAKSALDKIQAHLIKIRVSQINGCSFCIDKHIQEALKIGEESRRIFALTVWQETPFFSEQERAILALVEEMTLIADFGVSDEVYETAIELLGQQYTTEVMMAIVAMNAWNRIGIATGRKPE